MKRLVLGLFLGVCLYCLFVPVSCYAAEVAPRISDREIIESLTRLEEGVKANREAIEELSAELKAVVELLRNEMATLRAELLGFMKWGFGLLLSGMFILVGFILWDRRSVLKPIKDEIDTLERQKVDRLIVAMKKLSENDSQMAQVLRSVGLL